MRRLILITLVLTLGCSDHRENEGERRYRVFWSDPCAWRRATHTQRVVRVTTIASDEDLWHENPEALVRQREEARCEAQEEKHPTE